jgi:hypothetical protein
MSSSIPAICRATAASPKEIDRFSFKELFREGVVHFHITLISLLARMGELWAFSLYGGDGLTICLFNNNLV